MVAQASPTWLKATAPAKKTPKGLSPARKCKPTTKRYKAITMTVRHRNKHNSPLAAERVLDKAALNSCTKPSKATRCLGCRPKSATSRKFCTTTAICSITASSTCRTFVWEEHVVFQRSLSQRPASAGRKMTSSNTKMLSVQALKTAQTTIWRLIMRTRRIQARPMLSAFKYPYFTTCSTSSVQANKRWPSDTDMRATSSLYKYLRKIMFCKGPRQAPAIIARYRLGRST
mmetsp:Transcript_63650/g.207705  ORF Transcript_63650/g.207705 Transcript_63650/m.207705 type:complete len:230 (+) Transcript_63650:1151-1840(+)